MSLGYQRSTAVEAPQTRSELALLSGRGGIGNAALIDRLKKEGPTGLGGQPMVRSPRQQPGSTQGVQVAENDSTMSDASASAVASLPRTLFDPAALATVSAAVYALVPAEDQDADSRAGVDAVLKECAMAGLRGTSQVAYILATAEHESHFGHKRYDRSESLVEDRNAFSSRTRTNKKTKKTTTTWSSTVHTNDRRVTAPTEGELETKYWDSAYGGKLGNERGTTDGRDYRGRGFVQVTGRSNFARASQLLNTEKFSYTLDGTTWGGPGNAVIDLVAHPDHVNRCRELAARLEVKGMLEGAFTGAALGDSVAATGPEATREQYADARAVVNGDGAKNGGHIADIALKYARALTAGDAWTKVFAAQPAAGPTTAPAAPPTRS